jgi:hypothetical protein
MNHGMTGELRGAVSRSNGGVESETVRAQGPIPPEPPMRPPGQQPEPEFPPPLLPEPEIPPPPGQPPRPMPAPVRDPRLLG